MKTRLITIDYSEYQELLNIKECYEKNMKSLEGKVVITKEDYEIYTTLYLNRNKAIEFILDEDIDVTTIRYNDIQNVKNELLEILRGKDENSN